MPVFAMPGFGLEPFAYVLAIAFCAVVLLAVAMYFRGVSLIGREKNPRPKLGTVLILVSVLLPIVAWSGPPHVLRVLSGHYALTEASRFKIEAGMTGMTFTEVTNALGEPHERFKESDGSERWYYYTDDFGVDGYGLEFSPNGTVASVRRHI
jgi:hypothetical protein